MANLADFELLDTAFKSLRENTDITQDKKAFNIMATIQLTANGILDKAESCKIDPALVLMGSFHIYITTLKKRKYATTDEKPCRWASEQTEKQVDSLAKEMRKAFIMSMENKCKLEAR